MKTVKVKIKVSQLLDLFLPKRNGELLIKTDCTESKDGKATIEKFPDEITLEIPVDQVGKNSGGWVFVPPEEFKRLQENQKPKPRRKRFRIISPLELRRLSEKVVDGELFWNGGVVELEELEDFECQELDEKCPE